jgi:hypothetical protein
MATKAYEPPSMEEETSALIESFHQKHLSPDSEESYDHSSLKEELGFLIRASQQFRNKPGEKNVKKTREQIKARKNHSLALQPFIYAEHFAIANRLFSGELSDKFNVYKSAFHHFSHDGGDSAFKDGYLPSGQKPINTKDMFGLTMINSFTNSEFDSWVDGLLQGFEHFYAGYSKMKLIMFNWSYHQLPYVDELMLDLADKYCREVMSSSDEVLKELLIGQISESIERPGKIAYHTNWRFLRMVVLSMENMLDVAALAEK